MSRAMPTNWEARARKACLWIIAISVCAVLLKLAAPWGASVRPTPAAVAPADSQVAIAPIDPGRAFAFCHDIVAAWRLHAMDGYSDEEVANGVCMLEKIATAAAMQGWSAGDSRACFLAQNAMETTYSRRFPHGDLARARTRC